MYNSEEDNILQDFYIPVLSKSVSYDRAVGYFDAKMLTSSAAGLSKFIDNDGHMRLICGSTLTEPEYEAISLGYDARQLEERISDEFDQIIATVNDPLIEHQLQVLTWLVQNEKLDVKIALRRHGIHHQKIGVFQDIAGDFIVFQGSANETNNALLPFNYETINVFKSWLPEFRDHFEPHIASFNKLWSNKANDTLVLDISAIARSALTKKYPDVQRPNIQLEIDLWQKHLDSMMSSPSGLHPIIPDRLGDRKFQLHKHQKRALDNWQSNDFRGVFELATGSGKTITAIYGAIKMFQNRNRLFLVVAVPYQNLADQWAENLAIFNVRPIVCYGGEANWSSQLAKAVLDFKSGLTDFVAVVVVDATMTSHKRTFVDNLTLLGKDLSEYIMFVGDECHHHGAHSTYKALPETANLRMGLSATPDRGAEDDGNQRIEEYYGKIVDTYSLADALEDNVLTPYEYHLIPVAMTPDETEKYIMLSKKIAKLYAILKNTKFPSEQEEDGLNALLLKRAKLVNGSKNKPKALEELLGTLKPIKHSLFYCAEGMLENEDHEDDEGFRQIEIISSILHKHGWRSSRFTANENKARRAVILDDFKNEKVDSLVAMKCLDEGVDIPLCSTAFIMSSSRKERQFIQRRGRILRKSEGKIKAVIYDFVTTLPLENVSDPELGRKLMIAELKRINEFAGLALNKSSTYVDIEPYLKKYDLYHHVV